MQLSRILREGFIAGLIGAGAVALWFLVVDVIAGRPFFTPAMLGSAVFWGVRDPAQVVIEYSRIIGYTMIHVSAFIIVGTIAAVLAAEVEVVPPTPMLIRRVHPPTSNPGSSPPTELPPTNTRKFPGSTTNFMSLL